jgi:hypothetical protein
MDTKEIVIDDEIMEELREISIKKGRSLEETLRKYPCALNGGYEEFSQTTNIWDSEEVEEDSGVLAIDYFGKYLMEYIEEETWEDIRKEAAQTGESPDAIAQRFIDAMNKSMSTHKIPASLLALWQYTDNSETHEKEYRKVV